jgi:hypothetical protein
LSIKKFVWLPFIPLAAHMENPEITANADTGTQNVLATVSSKLGLLTAWIEKLKDMLVNTINIFR